MNRHPKPEDKEAIMKAVFAPLKREPPLSPSNGSVVWHRPSAEMPDDEETVLLALDDGEVWTGYHEAGEWRYVSADLCEATVVWWARFPDPPNVAAQ